MSNKKLFGLCFVLGICLFVFSGCAGSGGGSQPSASDSGPQDAIEAVNMDVSNSLEDAKQAAESAEWEAHRLREELNRKKNAQ